MGSRGRLRSEMEKLYVRRTQEYDLVVLLVSIPTIVVTAICLTLHTQWFCIHVTCCVSEFIWIGRVRVGVSIFTYISNIGCSCG
jgi:hypothetical protein